MINNNSKIKITSEKILNPEALIIISPKYVIRKRAFTFPEKCGLTS